MSTAAPSSQLPMPSPSASAALRQIFNSPPIYDALFSQCMGTTSPARLGRLHPGAGLAFQDYTTRSWHKRLLRYFPDPRAFRTFQARTGLLVSGSQPLQVFMGEDYGISSDVDLYPWPGTERDVGDWLIQQGYRLQNDGYSSKPMSFSALMDKVERIGWDRASLTYSVEMMDQYRGCESVACLLRFEKEQGEDECADGRPEGRRETADSDDEYEPENPRRALQVQVIVSRHSPVATILDFHSTPVMNFFTWNRAYSLFPRTSFDAHQMCILRARDNLDYDIVSKYEHRGFETSYEFPSDSRPSAIVDTKISRDMRRWVGDRFTWVVDLHVDGVVPPPTPEVDLTLNGFTVSLPKDDPDAQVEPSSGSASDSDESMSSEFSEESENVVAIVRKIVSHKAGLSTAYTIPEDFIATVRQIEETSKNFPPSHRGMFFDERDKTGRDGQLRQWKMAYERQKTGELQQRLLGYLLDPPAPPSFEEYMEDYDFYEAGRPDDDDEYAMYYGEYDEDVEWDDGDNGMEDAY